MSESRRDQVQRLFLEALDVPADQRADWLETRCGEDTALLHEVRSLLIEAERDVDPLERGAVDLVPMMSPRSSQGLGVGAGLHVHCPHCHNPIEFVHGGSSSEVFCQSCGSSFSLIEPGQETTDWPGRTLRQFQLVSKLGTGAFGTVWKAKDTSLDRFVAIKLPRKGQLTVDEAEKFLREARSASQIRHPGIVNVHEVGREDDQLFIVSEYIEGVTLADWLAVKQPSWRETSSLCQRIAEAVHHAHEHGVIHRDLKPSNIMLDAPGEPHVMDFGLAKREAGEITMTMEGQILGTPAYMSPEQAQGQGHDADRRSDVYSLGVILFEALTGELPFRGNARMLLHQVVHDEPPSLRRFNQHIPKDLETICLQCLQKDPGARYSSAAEFANDLNCWIEGKPISARPVSVVGKAWRWSQRNALVAGLSLAVVTVLLIGTTVASYFAVQENRRATQLTISQKSLRNSRDRATRLADNNLALAGAESESRQQAERVSQFLLDTIFEIGEAADEDVLDIAVDRLEEDFENDPYTKSLVLAAIGRGYLVNFSIEESVEALEQATELQRDFLEEPGSDPPSLWLLAIAYEQDYRTTEAIQLHERLLPAKRRALGNTHPDVLWMMSSLGWAYFDIDRIAEASATFDEVFQIRREQSGLAAPETLEALSDLAMVYDYEGQFEESAKLYELAFNSQKQSAGIEAKPTLSILVKLASSYVRTGRLDEALALYSEAEPSFRTETDDFGLKSSLLQGFASALFAVGDDERGIELLEELLDEQRTRSGVVNRTTLSMMSNLAANQKRIGAHEDAIALYEEAFEICHREPTLAGGESSQRRYLRQAYQAAGRPWDAVDFLRGCVREHQAERGPADPATLRVAVELGMALHAGGRVPEGIRRLEEAFEHMVTHSAEFEDYEFESVARKLTRTYIELEQFEHAIVLQQDLLKLFERNYGAEHATTLSYLGGLAWQYATSSEIRLRNGPRAVEYALKSCELTHWSIGDTFDTLAAAYAEAGDFDTAVRWETAAMEASGSPEALEVFGSRRELYRQAQPLRETPRLPPQ